MSCWQCPTLKTRSAILNKLASTAVKLITGESSFQEKHPGKLPSGKRLYTQHSIVVRSTAVRAISTNIICQTIVQHCRASDLELTATCCVKLRRSLYFQFLTLNSYCTFLLISVNYST